MQFLREPWPWLLMAGHGLLPAPAAAHPNVATGTGSLAYLISSAVAVGLFVALALFSRRQTRR